MINLQSAATNIQRTCNRNIKFSLSQMSISFQILASFTCYICPYSSFTSAETTFSTISLALDVLLLVQTFGILGNLKLMNPFFPWGPIKYNRLGNNTRDAINEESIVHISMSPAFWSAIVLQILKNTPEMKVVRAPDKIEPPIRS